MGRLKGLPINGPDKKQNTVDSMFQGADGASIVADKKPAAKKKAAKDISNK